MSAPGREGRHRPACAVMTKSGLGQGTGNGWEKQEEERGGQGQTPQLYAYAQSRKPVQKSGIICASATSPPRLAPVAYVLLCPRPACLRNAMLKTRRKGKPLPHDGPRAGWAGLSELAHLGGGWWWWCPARETGGPRVESAQAFCPPPGAPGIALEGRLLHYMARGRAQQAEREE